MIIYIPFERANKVLNQMNSARVEFQKVSFNPKTDLSNRKKINFISFLTRDRKLGRFRCSHRANDAPNDSNRIDLFLSRYNLLWSLYGKLLFGPDYRVASSFLHYDDAKSDSKHGFINYNL